MKTATWTRARAIKPGDTLAFPPPVFVVRNVAIEGDEIVVTGGPGVSRRFAPEDKVNVMRGRTAAGPINFEQWAEGIPMIADSYAADLRPEAWEGILDAPAEPFLGSYVLRHNADPVYPYDYTVFDGDRPIASMTLGQLVVDPAYRNKGIGEGLVKRFLLDHPDYKPRTLNSKSYPVFERAFNALYPQGKQARKTPATVPTSQEILVIVHPGSCCGSADFHLGANTATEHRRILTNYLDDWRKGVIVFHGELDDELQMHPYTRLGAAVESVLTRAKAAGHLSLAVQAWDPEQETQMRTLLANAEAYGITPDTKFMLTGAWVYSDRDGCVGSVNAILSDAGYKSTISHSAFTDYAPGDDPDEEYEEGHRTASLKTAALRFTWDPTKAAANLKKHGVSFEEASTIFDDPNVYIVPDETHSDDEQRWIATGLSKQTPRVLVAVHTEHEEGTIRIISARRASRTEQQTYAKHARGRRVHRLLGYTADQKLGSGPSRALRENNAHLARTAQAETQSVKTAAPLPQLIRTMTRGEAVALRTQANGGKPVDYSRSMPEGEYALLSMPMARVDYTPQNDEQTEALASNRNPLPPLFAGYSTMAAERRAPVVYVFDGNRRATAARMRGDVNVQVVMEKAAYDRYLQVVGGAVSRAAALGKTGAEYAPWMRPWLTGYCYDFALALKEKMPSGEFVSVDQPPYPSHVGLRVGDAIYDVRGRLTEDEFKDNIIGAKGVFPVGEDVVLLMAGLANSKPPYRGKHMREARKAVQRMLAESKIAASVGVKQAKRIGPVYHGAREWYSTIRNDQYRTGRFFSSSPEAAKKYGPKVFKAYLTINKPFTVDAKEESYYSIPTPKAMRKWTHLDTVTADNIAAYAYKNGYDGVIIKNVFEGNGVEVTADDYIVFNPSQIEVVAEADVIKSEWSGIWFHEVGEWREKQAKIAASASPDIEIAEQQETEPDGRTIHRLTLRKAGEHICTLHFAVENNRPVDYVLKFAKPEYEQKYSAGALFRRAKEIAHAEGRISWDIAQWASGDCWSWAIAYQKIFGGKLYVIRCYHDDGNDDEDNGRLMNVPDSDLGTYTYEDVHAFVSFDNGITGYDAYGHRDTQQMCEQAKQSLGPLDFASGEDVRPMIVPVSKRFLRQTQEVDRVAEAVKWIKSHDVAAPNKTSTLASAAPDLDIKERNGMYFAYVNGKNVATASLSDDGTYLVSVHVEPEYRRQGIARALYKYIEQHIGHSLRPSPTYQTEAAKAFWENRKQAAPQDFTYHLFTLGEDDWAVVALDSHAHVEAESKYLGFKHGVNWAELPKGFTRWNVIGRVEIWPAYRGPGAFEGKYYRGENLFVDERYRRQGVATGMYLYFEKATGLKLEPSNAQSDAGKAFWEKRKNAMTDEGSSQPNPFPQKSFSRLWHVGTLNSTDKVDFSHEGSGLSVSQHPEEWRTIARLGDADLWVLTKNQNRFLDFRSMTPEHQKTIFDWGQACGYITGEGKSLVANAKMVERVGSAAKHRALVLDLLTTLFAEEELRWDGVWWQDRLSVSNYSAPRGVIFNNQLPSWTIRRAAEAATGKKHAMKINVPESEHEHFWQEPPEGHEEFWALRFPPKAKIGDPIVFHMNKKPVAEAVISRIEKPGEHECEQTGRFKNRWKIYWSPQSFKKIAAPRRPKLPEPESVHDPNFPDFDAFIKRSGGIKKWQFLWEFGPLKIGTRGI